MANQINNYSRLSAYGLFFSVLGAASYTMLFPSGIYYGFFCAVVGVTAGILSHKYTKKKLSATLAIVIGVIDLIICLLAYHGLDSLYTSLRDPVLGPEITKFVTEFLKQYNIPIDTFAAMLRQ